MSAWTNGAPVGNRRFEIHFHVARFVVDVDQPTGILGDIAVGGDHHGDALADVIDLVAGQRPLGLAAAGDRCVRDQHRQFDVERADVVGRIDRYHVVQRFGGRGVDTEDARPREG